MTNRLLRYTVLLWAVGCGWMWAQQVRAPTPLAEARPALAALANYLPDGLAGKTASQLEAAWPAWVARRDGEIRTRLSRADEDAVVNLWLYGTSFTTVPRATAVLDQRLDDFINGLATPGSNERLQQARDLVTQLGLDPTTSDRRTALRRRLIEMRNRVIAEFEEYDRTIAANRRQDAGRGDASVYATIFSARGLSSDTSLLPGFGVERALAAAAAQLQIAPATIRDVAIIGPGLDVISKADGYDFYPMQTIQPFAVADSLIRLGLARPEDLRLTTFDLSPRVNGHIDAARRRARSGSSYTVQVPLNADEPWSADVWSYWRRFGSEVGVDKPAAPLPGEAGNVRIRAIDVHPALVASIEAIDLNVVVQRLEQRQFDLIVATNVLLYYDVFEQALAMVNAAAMLRSGGLVLTNTAVLPLPPIRPQAGYLEVVYSPKQRDQFFWYRKE